MSSLSPGSRIGGFEILRLVDKGGMGIVYEAKDLMLERTVAIKFMQSGQDSDLALRFINEGKALAKVTHPNIVQVIGMGMHEDSPYIVMELISGGSLKGWLTKGRFLPGDIFYIFEKLTEGLLALHSAGVYHRDLKPSNILLTENGLPKITDFGLAKSAGMFSPDLTDTGNLVGTIQYMAPEVLAGEPYSAQSDQYALGLVCFELIEGANPFLGQTAVETIDKVRDYNHAFSPYSLVNLPVKLQDWIRVCMSYESKDRFADLREAIDCLSAVLEEVRKDELFKVRSSEMSVAQAQSSKNFFFGNTSCSPFEKAHRCVQLLVPSTKMQASTSATDEFEIESVSVEPERPSPRPLVRKEQDIELAIDPEQEHRATQPKPKKVEYVKLEVERHDKESELDKKRTTIDKVKSLFKKK